MNLRSQHTLNYKIYIIAYITYCIIGIMVLRLMYLQISLTERFTTRSQKNFLQIKTIQSPRGNIIDRYGRLLATNRPLTNLLWQGTGQYRLLPEQYDMLEKISAIVNKPITHDEELIKKITHAERHRKQTLIATDLSLEQLSQIAEQFSSTSNITISTHFKRHYPHHAFASHLLGYLGTMGIDQYGKTGLEKLFEDTLKGEHGTEVNVIDSLGRNVTQTTLKEALCGNTIQTTLDIDLQQLCENVFPADVCGTCIIMDPTDGALLAVLSRPNFDPTIFLEKIRDDVWQELQKNNPFLNRAFNAMYPPGSIFKLITITAALEEHLIEQDATFNCKGFYTFGDHTHWCNRKSGHGKLTLNQALAQSCNPPLYYIGAHMDIDTLASYAYKFGLGKKTNTMFPEQTGIVPNKSWKQEKKGERWWPGETLSVAIGQSFLLATPIQIARMISAIYTGYLVNTRILFNQPIEKQLLDINQDTRKFLKKSMRRVVTSGTGKRLKYLKDIKVYAKTSTAQTSALEKRNLSADYWEHGWFAGNIVYKDHAPLTIVILVERAGSASVSTEIAKEFLIRYKKLMDGKV
ncbi:MAG TPA: penicillin-binding transpeptidase domain-containing protein [Candidatus Dependentiae bacterium]|mgnify:CR=1 FL=1|nr:penicillin-binding transpeptidase domain-containing protein [Candidatus Dependentiae bacterium]HRQ62601.1 penicillin-binding transpeptidase domain-containing protein [Candidatus Dependentiae bacterium]